MKATCKYCNNTYSRPPSLIGNFCSKTCAYLARKKEFTKHRRIRYLPMHPLAGKTGLVSAARAILFDAIGIEPHPCYWCGKLVAWHIGEKGNLADALIADHRDNNPLNDSPENIIPSCGSCNGSRSRTVKDGEIFIVRKNGTRLRAIECVCAFCNKPFLAIPAAIAQGRGRFCSRSCARSKTHKHCPTCTCCEHVQLA